MDEGKAVDVVFLHFGKAYDIVTHSCLLDELPKCRMSRFMVCWVMEVAEWQGSKGCSEWGLILYLVQNNAGHK